MIENTYILQIETATPVCSVAISKNGKTIAQVEADEPNLHASHLTLFIEQVVKNAALTLNDVDAVAVSMGPGSYTGLRIGVSTAKGLCYALDIPLIAINTLDAMLHGFVLEADLAETIHSVFVPMIDARRMEVYMATYDKQLQCLSETEARIIEADSFTADMEKNYILFGSGADKLQALFENNTAVEVLPGFRNAASFLSQLAFQKYERHELEDMVGFEPYYLKDFIATTPKKRS